MSIVSKNLQEEREKISFNLKELTTLIYGSKQEAETFLKAQEYMDNSPIHKHNPDDQNLSRIEKMQGYIKRFHDYHKHFNYNNIESILLGFAFFNEPVITSLHQVMFIPCLKNLATPKQYEKWYLIHFIFFIYVIKIQGSFG
jgi:hypothetical protein